MKANYHTHTSRCGHACGTDEEYVLAAVAQGYGELGFSDHVPWPYRGGFTNPGVRMHVDRLDEYLASVRALKARYADRIRILAGFECEYFPEYMNWLSEMKEEKQLDYLILGNHHDQTDETGMYFGLSKEPAHLSAYVRSAIKGIESGLFAYLAHPDLFMRRYPQFDDNCRAAARDLAQACRAANLPMEYNLHDRYLGVRKSPQGYPNAEFFEIAASEGVRVIIGIDAHDPLEIANPDQWERACAELDAAGIIRMESLGK